MSLVAIVQAGTVPRVVLAGAPLGATIEGRTADGGRWLVTNSYPGHPIVDPLAPLGVQCWYEGGGKITPPLRRESLVYSAFTSLDGTVVVPFIMPHAWSESVNTGLRVIEAGGELWTSYERAPLPGRNKVSARVAGRDITAMRALLRTQAEFAFLHNDCPVPHCPVPRAVTVVVDTAGAVATARKDLGELEFSLDIQPVTVTTVAPARSWWHTLTEYDTWHEVDLIAEAFK